MFSRLQALKYITYRAAWACDHQKGRMVPLLTSLVKHYVPQQAKAIIDEAINIFGATVTSWIRRWKGATGTTG